MVFDTISLSYILHYQCFSCFVWMLCVDTDASTIWLWFLLSFPLPIQVYFTLTYREAFDDKMLHLGLLTWLSMWALYQPILLIYQCLLHAEFMFLGASSRWYALYSSQVVGQVCLFKVSLMLCFFCHFKFGSDFVTKNNLAFFPNAWWKCH